MELNNKQIYLSKDTTDKTKQDVVLSEVGVLDVYENKQPLIYYKSGCAEIDDIFREKNYLKQGYICNLIATRKQISLYFCRYKVDNVIDLAGVHIFRNQIIKTVKSRNDNLDFIKKESIKNQSKYMFKRGSFLGAIIGAATEGVKNVNLKKDIGFCYSIYFKNVNDSESKLTIYCHSDYEYDIDYFMKRFCKMKND